MSAGRRQERAGPLGQAGSTAAAGPRARLCLLLAVLGWTGLLLQLRLSVLGALGSGGSVPAALVAYFGYFTILTNIFVALMATAGTGVRWARGRVLAALYRPHAVGCATTSILVVGLVYHLLLRVDWPLWSAHWVADALLHYVVPSLSLLHWLLYRPVTPGAWTLPPLWAPLAWCAYPLAYLLYVLVRGPLVGAYPYFFLDVTAIGYARVLLNAAGLALLLSLMGLAVLGLKHLALSWVLLSSRSR
ncbi:MAG TPA: Pr6Pr family membrane protein [Steroidobacteraceae bacterium]|nr:Pr6Pr family membrane protein [Steroidobacteraceae bacterium]